MDIFQPATVPPALTNVLMGLHRDDATRMEQAFRFAAAAHDGQTRDEGTPFIEHPIAVVDVLYKELGCRDVDVLLAALCHDVLEDVPCITRAVLADLIGERATGFVENVTKAKVADADKQERDERYMQHLVEVDRESKLLKLADRIHNLRSILNSNDREKAKRYLVVSRERFLPLALSVDPVAAELISQACDAIEEMLAADAERSG